MKPVFESRDVLAIHEENHGIIGVADCAFSAAQFIISQDWVTPYEEVWCAHEQQYITVYEAMERLGYFHDDDAFRDFCAAMFEDKHEGYDWGFHLSSMKFWERRTIA